MQRKIAITSVLAITMMALAGSVHASVSNDPIMQSSISGGLVNQSRPGLDVTIGSLNGSSVAQRYLRLHNVVSEMPKGYDMKQSELFGKPIRELHGTERLVK